MNKEDLIYVDADARYMYASASDYLEAWKDTKEKTKELELKFLQKFMYTEIVDTICYINNNSNKNNLDPKAVLAYMMTYVLCRSEIIEDLDYHVIFNNILMKNNIEVTACDLGKNQLQGSKVITGYGTLNYTNGNLTLTRLEGSVTTFKKLECNQNLLIKF